ncbi:hypothetical protein [Jatrophihabitans lederbergiae]|uniref:Helix-turn-helix domain containing protein n=1 Tax=Jatrophihabitans lederbergiae TaxID=3075547 RepID=A0ABU2JBE9_9ACTN|nr:hypothetical protein [Jatrophihabitans sp. DSM 44399]MDT0262301.1 hypothetical protein [Jatrophihabitans sp. DSM 44399]
MSANRVCPECRFTGSYATDAIADYQHGRHSCAKQLRRAECARRRAERRANGIKRDCDHQRAHHVHGTRTAYVRDRCRCQRCTAANTAASRCANRDRAYGHWQPYIDASPATAHIHVLRASGFGLRRIADLAHVSTSTLRALLGTGPDGATARAKIRPDTAARILAIEPERAAPAAYSKVDPTGTRRRLQALVAIGWTLAQLAVQLHRTTTHLTRTLAAAHVTARTAKQVRDLYNRLWNVRPPQHTSAERAAVEAARTAAAQRGWLPPLVWDDIDSDPDPDPYKRDQASAGAADIDGIAIERAVAGDGVRLDQLTPAEQAEVVRRMTERGKSIRDIATQLSTTRRTVSRRRETVNAT